ncbi:MAG: hypothetical protein A2Y66_02415 [Nitrospirae bacterium RBG_13_41_22]|nr:MAG: hypothetical protein A2Y66_02415 [Nitrospirae bacterium RBG_13_41_22]
MNDFCVFLPVDYEGPPGRWRFLTEALASRLEGMSKVLCVNRPVCPVVTSIRHRDKLLRWLSELGGRSGHVQQITDNLFVFTPFILLHDQLAARFSLLVRLNRALLGWQLIRTLTRLAFRRSQLTTVISTPYQKDYIGIIGETFLIYDCYDEYLAPTNFRNSALLRQLEEKDREILRKADIVFGASEPIVEKRRKFNKNVYFIPNAVDYNHFSNAFDEKTPIPDDITHIPHPIIGFVGNMNQSIDFNLLTFLAHQRPEWSLVLIGSLNSCERGFMRSKELREARSFKNIYFIGGRPFEQIPGYLKAFDICLIPYKDTEFNRSRSPVKLYEYMASGKPIVSIPVCQCQEFEEAIEIAKDHKSFLEAIERLLAKDHKTTQNNLMIAKENSWDSRAETVLSLIGDRLQASHREHGRGR